MLITGGITSSMSVSFFNDLGEAGINRSRLWWEIVLNLQILCGALVWFSFVEQIKTAVGPRYYIRLAQFFVALVAVLLPTLVGLAGIAMGWFENSPDLAALNGLIVVCLILWGMGVALPIAVQVATEGRWRMPPFLLARHPVGLVLKVSPLLAAILLAVIEIAQGGVAHYLYGPFLLYMQGAMLYLVRAIRLERG